MRLIKKSVAKRSFESEEHGEELTLMRLFVTRYNRVNSQLSEFGKQENEKRIFQYVNLSKPKTITRTKRKKYFLV